MLKIVACLAAVLLLLLLTEILRRQKKLKGENQRKTVHIIGGVFVAFWPWLISWRAIQLVGMTLLVGVLINYRLNFFSYHKETKRETYGDLFSALIITICAALTTNRIFFCLAILQLALADGFAAVIGENFGRRGKYIVFSLKKSIVGTLTFYLCSLFIFAGAIILSSLDLSGSGAYFLILGIAPIILMLAENLSPLGADNISIPLLTLFFLGLVG